MAAAGQAWALALFRRSVLKQEKLRQIVALLGDVEGKSCLDIGGDNGVVSYLLRERGGRWQSADLDAGTVESIRQLVGGDVQRIDGERTPYPDRAFDVVVIVDFLEHVHTDRRFCEELARILKPGGAVVVNVPHLKPRSLLNRVRHAIGLTDDKHGHVRPGYSLQGLREVLGERFVLQQSRTYSRAFSELVDIGLNVVYERGRSPGVPASAKGTVVTRGDLEKRRTQFRILSLSYPVLWALARLDRLLFLQPGYKLIARFSLHSPDGQPEEPTEPAAAPGEAPDVETASEGYARRFAGPVGRFFLERQLETALDLLAPWPRARVLDVGGGHAQLAVPLVEAGFAVTVTGSRDVCEDRLRGALAPGRYAFRRADLLRLPFEDRSFDVVIAFRLLPHVERWERLLAEMCRLARHAVIVDYPDARSVNLLADRLFGLKRAVEGNTRPYRCFRRDEVTAALAAHGFGAPVFRPQFAAPMVLHRGLGSARAARAIEGVARRLGLTERFGSPVIARFVPAGGRTG